MYILMAEYVTELTETLCFDLLDVFEVGVHIADVSYFVQAGTPLDAIASQRATSVYLVQKVHESCITCVLYPSTNLCCWMQ